MPFGVGATRRPGRRSTATTRHAGGAPRRRRPGASPSTRGRGGRRSAVGWRRARTSGSNGGSAVGVDVDEHERQRGVGLVAAEHVRRDAIGHPQGAGEERPVRVVDLDQPAADERGRRARGGAGRRRSAAMHAGQAERQPDADPPAGHVVVEVAVVALEAIVDVGRHRRQQQLDVEVVELEALGQRAQAELGAARCRGDRPSTRPPPDARRRRRRSTQTRSLRSSSSISFVAEVQPEERDRRASASTARRAATSGGDALAERRRAGRAGGRARRRWQRRPVDVHQARSRPARAGLAAPAAAGVAARTRSASSATRPAARPAPPCSSRPHRGGVDHADQRLDARPAGRPRSKRSGSSGAIEAQVERRLQLAAERRPHVRQRPVLRRRQGDGQRDAEAEVGERCR